MFVPMSLLLSKLGIALADLAFGFAQHLLRGLVHVDDVVVGVRKHHVRAGYVEGGADTVVDDFSSDLIFEDLGGLGNLADLVGPVRIRDLDEAVVGELAQNPGHLA